MLKITISVSDIKNSGSCKVTLTGPKDLSKSSKDEKNTTAMIYNKISEVLQDLKQQN